MNGYNEYRVVFNAYDGLGNIEHTITSDPVKAIEIRLELEKTKVNEKGKAWIEYRKVTNWIRTGK